MKKDKHLQTKRMALVAVMFLVLSGILFFLFLRNGGFFSAGKDKIFLETWEIGDGCLFDSELSFCLVLRDKGVYRGELSDGRIDRIAGDMGYIADVKGTKYLLLPKERTARGTAVVEYDAEKGEWETLIEDLGDFFLWSDGNYEQLADNFRYIPGSDDISFTINIGLSEYNANPDETELYLFNRESGEVSFLCTLPSFRQESFHNGVYSWGENRNILHLYTGKAIYEYCLNTEELKRLDNSGYLEKRMSYSLMQDGQSVYYMSFAEDEGSSGKGIGVLRRYWFEEDREEIICGEIPLPEIENKNLLACSLKASPDGRYVFVRVMDDTCYEVIASGDGSYTTQDFVSEYLYLADAEKGNVYPILENRDSQREEIIGFFWETIP